MTSLALRRRASSFGRRCKRVSWRKSGVKHFERSTWCYIYDIRKDISLWLSFTQTDVGLYCCFCCVDCSSFGRYRVGDPSWSHDVMTLLLQLYTSTLTIAILVSHAIEIFRTFDKCNYYGNVSNARWQYEFLKVWSDAKIVYTTSMRSKRLMSGWARWRRLAVAMVACMTSKKLTEAVLLDWRKKERKLDYLFLRKDHHPSFCTRNCGRFALLLKDKTKLCGFEEETTKLPTLQNS